MNFEVEERDVDTEEKLDVPMEINISRGSGRKTKKIHTNKIYGIKNQFFLR